MTIRFQWPLYHHECYECPGAWEIRWPLRRYRKLTPEQRAASGFISELALEMNREMAESFKKAAIYTTTTPPKTGDTIKIPHITTMPGDGEKVKQ